MKYLLDTNICIYLIKRRPSHLNPRFEAQAMGEIGLSSITVAELQFGVEKSNFVQRNQAALDQFLVPLHIVCFDAESAVRYGQIRSFLENQGAPIGSLDTLIAAHALRLDVTLVTNNVQEFQRVPGLRLENWAQTYT